MIQVLACQYNVEKITEVAHASHVKYIFGSFNCSLDHKIYFVKCPLCPFNADGSMRPYFSFSKCSCATEGYKYYCIFCLRLCSFLNNNLQKACQNIDSAGVLSSFNLVDTDMYSYDLKASLFFVHNREQQAVFVWLDHPDERNFFVPRETRDA